MLQKCLEAYVNFITSNRNCILVQISITSLSIYSPLQKEKNEIQLLSSTATVRCEEQHCHCKKNIKKPRWENKKKQEKPRSNFYRFGSNLVTKSYFFSKKPNFSREKFHFIRQNF